MNIYYIYINIYINIIQKKIYNKHQKIYICIKRLFTNYLYNSFIDKNYGIKFIISEYEI